MASGLTYQVFVILARFSTTCHGWPLFRDSQPYLHWAQSVPTGGTFTTCGNTTCGALVFPPDKVMHCMILGWKTDVMGLMLAFQFTMPFSITQGQNFPRSPFNLAQHLSSIHQNQLQHILPYHHTLDNTTQGITNTLGLSIDKMLYICLLCPHSKHQNNSFQSKQSKHFHKRNRFS